MEFKKNLGKWDRVLRFSLAIGLLAWAYFAHSWILLAVSIFVFFEAFMSWCVMYQILGKSSCPVKKK